MLTQPMKAARADNLADIWYPCAATPKIDGIRALVVNGVLLSKSFKPIPNRYIQGLCSKLPYGLDGELISGESFQSTTSAVMRHSGEPQFTYIVFDQYHDTLGYWDRVDSIPQLPDFCTVLRPTALYSREQLEAFELQCVSDGYEGIMTRDATGRYKCGRCTLSSQLLIKYKRFVDSEAIVLAVHEGNTNANPIQQNAFGYTKRPGGSAGKLPRGTMGSLECKDIHTGQSVSIGSGFDEAMRRAVWSAPAAYIGLVLKYRYQQVGVKDAPRFPRFVSWVSSVEL